MTATPAPRAKDALKPCPFCGAGETQMDETTTRPTMSGKTSLISVEIRHFCAPMPGMLGRSSVVFAGRDHASAIAAWNRRITEIQQEATRDAG